MSAQSSHLRTSSLTDQVDARLAAYLSAAGAVGVSLASTAEAAIVGQNTPQAFGINGEVSIDFNQDGQIDFQIDHDRVNLNGTLLDYLQVDKNDDNSATNPLAYPGFIVEGQNLYQNHFPLNGSLKNNDSQILSFTNGIGDLGGYVVALKAGDVIGGEGAGSFVPGTVWDYQENDNFTGSGRSIRANRLIDEDATQIDQTLGGLTSEQVFVPLGPQAEFPELDNFIGLAGATRYVGVRVDLNDAAEASLNNSDINQNLDFPQHFWYGWIGVRIDNEADATGVVTGWAYESEQGKSIVAGDAGAVANADFDRDGQVTGGDFLLWQRQLGSTVTAGTGADGNSDAKIDSLDLAIWKEGFGSATVAVTPAGEVVPEPSSLLAALSGLLLFGSWMVKRARLTRRAASSFTARQLGESLNENGICHGVRRPIVKFHCRVCNGSASHRSGIPGTERCGPAAAQRASPA
jgi:hypothetical protein